MPLAAPLVVALALTSSAPVTVERGAATAVGLSFVSTATWLSLVISQPEHAPRQCRVCASNALDEAASAAARWRRPKLADTLSNVGLALTPAWALGALAAAGSGRGDRRAMGFDTLLVVEATSVAMALNQLVKFEVARERPDIHHGRARGGVEDNVSFFSGHTTWGFASAVSAGTVASLRGYRAAPAVWAGGLAFAATTGYLRMGADRHWLTDVLTGAVVGTVVGAVLPRLHLAAEGAPVGAVAKGITTQGAAPAWITVGGVF
jgi:membrane-associated phospholipid phosphatase